MFAYTNVYINKEEYNIINVTRHIIAEKDIILCISEKVQPNLWNFRVSYNVEA